jgi:hypothetical protein
MTYNPGTRVFFWSAKGQVCYGIIQSKYKMPDVSRSLVIPRPMLNVVQGCEILVIKEDSGREIQLP